MEGKQIIIFYSDGERVSRKDGLCTEDGVLFITLDKKIMIPKSRIVRIELGALQ